MVKTLTKIMNAMHSDRYVKVVRSLKIGELNHALEKCYYGELKAFDSALYNRKRDYGSWNYYKMQWSMSMRDVTRPI